MNLTTHGLVDTGLLRPKNEDAYLIDRERSLYAVADGLGGLPGGGVASKRALERLVELVDRRRARGEAVELESIVKEAGEAVLAEGAADEALSGMATTLTAGHIEGNALQLAHAGDSAAFLARYGDLAKLTVDHTMEQEMLDHWGPEASRVMPAHYPHTLTRCLGQTDPLEVDIATHPLQRGDRILWLTDGITKVVSEETIAELVAGASSPEALAERLRDAAYEAGAPDNMAVVAAFVDARSEN